MKRIAIAGGGAFGTALAIALAGARRVQVTLWMRDAARAAVMQAERTAPGPGDARLPTALQITADPAAFAGHHGVLLAIPTQALRGFLSAHGTALGDAVLIAGCKGAEAATGLFPTGIIRQVCPDAPRAVLSGPGFAAEIARNLPTAMTVASADAALAETLREALSTPTLRLYSSTDTTGVQAGGALKNVIAIACGMTIGAGLGENARAAIMTRGFAEMSRLATALGAQPDTLAGLSGFGDLALTCTSTQSRNYTHGMGLARGQAATGVTVEGAATARAVVALAERHGVEMPVAAAVADVLDGTASLNEAVMRLLSRPRRSETDHN